MFQFVDAMFDRNDARRNGDDGRYATPMPAAPDHRRIRTEQNDRLVQQFCEYRQHGGMAFRGLATVGPQGVG